MLRRFSLPLIAVLVAMCAVPAVADAGDRTFTYWWAQDGTPNHQVVDSNSGYCQFRANIGPWGYAWVTQAGRRCVVRSFVGPGTTSQVYGGYWPVATTGCSNFVQHPNDPDTWVYLNCGWPQVGNASHVAEWTRADIGGGFHWQAGANYSVNSPGDRVASVGPSGEVLALKVWVRP